MLLGDRDRLLRRPSMDTTGKELSDGVFANEFKDSDRLTLDVLSL
jgi:hypothetical protein